jgi:hypothetical protein
MAAGSKKSQRSSRAALFAAVIVLLSCGGKTKVYLGTSPGPATAEAGTTTGAAGNGLGGLGGSIGPDTCPSSSTTVSGKVYDPAGKVPLYNVLVYVPGDNDVVPPQPGLACDRCDTKIAAASAALSDGTGTFVLKNVPPGDQLLVIQTGKWFRSVPISVTACQDNPLKADQTNLPASAQFGKLPHIAVTTGHSDTLECLLRKIGIDDSEFGTDADPDKHVQMFVGCPNPDANNHLGASAFNAALGGAKFPDATTLWSDPTKLHEYDMVVMSCEGTQCDNTKDKTMRQNIKDYADNGGRLFLSHDQFIWLRSGIDPWPKTADYVGADKDPLPSPFVSQIDATFPKGDAFSKWLQTVDTSDAQGMITMRNVRYTVRATHPPMTQRWIYTDHNPLDSTGNAVEYMTMNTPVETTDPDKICGRVVFTDLHLLPVDPGQSGDVAPFPDACDKSQALSPQELALEFMIFDLSACLISDATKQDPPAIIN